MCLEGEELAGVKWSTDMGLRIGEEWGRNLFCCPVPCSKVKIPLRHQKKRTLAFPERQLLSAI